MFLIKHQANIVNYTLLVIKIAKLEGNGLTNAKIT